VSVACARLKDHLSDLAVTSHEARSPTRLFEAFASGIVRALGAEFVEILEHLGTEGAFVLRCARGLPDDQIGRARVPGGLLSQAGRAFLDPSGRPVELEDMSHPHDWADSDLLVGHGAKSGAAIRVEDSGKHFGVLGVFYAAPRSFTSEEREFFRRASALLGAGLQRLRREREASDWRSRSELLRAGAALLKVPAERDAVLFAAAVAGVGVGPGGARPMADWCAADALETGGRRPRLSRAGVAHASGNAERLEESLSVPLAPSAAHGASRVFATRQPELVRRCDEAFVRAVASDEEHRRALEEVKPFSYICVPVTGAYRFLGVLGFVRSERGIAVPFDDDDLAVCSEFAGLVGAAIEHGEVGPDLAEAQEAVRAHVGTQAPALTEREHEVLAGIAGGARLTQIARSLTIAPTTVRTHKRHLCDKLGLKPGAADALIVAEARRRGVADLPV
jgi:GAF domain-containing protein